MNNRWMNKHLLFGQLGHVEGAKGWKRIVGASGIRINGACRNLVSCLFRVA